MLLGVRGLRGDKLVREGHRLRIYTPYGKQWREYSMRRLQENPKIAGLHPRRPLRRQRQVIWASAEGCRVWDEDGREYLDLSGGFGVAALGHSNPKIRAALAEQPVTHALGDLAEAEVTVRLRERLGRPAKLGVTGEDAVEIALRTALLATGKPGIVAFEGAYHGTGLLALAATGFEHFREPFAPWLPGPVHRFPYGEDPGQLPRGRRLRDRRADAGPRRRAGSPGWLPRAAARTLRRGGRAPDRGRDLLRARPHRRHLALGQSRGRALHRQGARRRAAALGGALPSGARAGLGARARGRVHAHAHGQPTGLRGGARRARRDSARCSTG